MQKPQLEKIETALKQELAPVSLQSVEVREGRDHDEDLAIFVTATLAPGAPPLPGQVSMSANAAVAHVLRELNDHRLSYLYLKRPDDERPLEDLVPVSRRDDPS